MKKALSLILALVLCLSLCACGVSKEKVDADLQGTWEHSWYASAVGFNCSIIYEFDDGFLTYTFIRNGQVSSQRGHYIITNKTIETYITGEDGIKNELTYTYEDGKLTIVDYGDGTVTNRYIKVS